VDQEAAVSIEAAEIVVDAVLAAEIEETKSYIISIL
jgi:hypothetical protein